MITSFFVQICLHLYIYMSIIILHYMVLQIFKFISYYTKCLLRAEDHVPMHRAWSLQGEHTVCFPE